MPQASVAQESRSQMVGTDPDGRYRLRLPPGRTRLYVGHLPDGFAQLPTAASEQVIDVPQGVDRFEVPPMVVAKLTDDVSPRVVPRR